MSDDRVSGDLNDLMGRIGEWRDDADAAASARARSRRYWLGRQAAESTTLTGVVLTLAERDAPVTIRTAAGAHCGAITSVTTALCTLDTDVGHVLIPVAGIVAVEAGPVAINDDRTPTTTTDLLDALAGLAPDRPAVTLLLSDGTEVAGALTVVGADAVAVTDRGGNVTYVPPGAIASCVLPLQ